MGYVRSRKFCCCLPVRFGVFCMALLGLVSGGVFGVAGWIQVHKSMNGQLDVDEGEKVALWIFSITYSFMCLISLIGLIGSLGRLRSFIKTYAYTVTTTTIVIIAAGIYFVWALFHRDTNALDKCVGGTTGDIGEVKSWVCEKGFDVIRIVITVILVIVWIFQLAGLFIVFDYVGQLNEEHDLEEEEYLKRESPLPGFVNVAYPATANNTMVNPAYLNPTAGTAPPMRTTYDAAPYDASAMQGGWTSARSPYAFALPEHSHGNPNAPSGSKMGDNLV